MMPRKPVTVERADIHALAYPEFYSLGQQADARDNLRALLGDSVADLDQKRRVEQGEPVMANTEPAPEPESTESELADQEIRDRQYASDKALAAQNKD
jgi:hypothetical protein